MPQQTDEQFVDGAAQERFEFPLMQGMIQMSRFAWRHKLLIVLGVALGLGLAAAYYTTSKPAYRSTAQIMVQLKRPNALPIPGTDPRYSVLSDSLAEHQTLLGSRMMAELAVENSNLTSLDSFRSTEDGVEIDAAGVVARSLEVQREVKDALIQDRSIVVLNLVYVCENQKDCSTILQAVIDAYDVHLDTDHRSTNDEIYALFTHWQDELQKDLVAKQEEYEKMLNNVLPSQWQSEGGINLSEKRVADIATQRQTLLVQLSEDSVRLEALKKARAEGVSNEVLYDMVTTWTRGAAEYVSERDQLLTLLLEEKRLKQIYGPANREVEAVREQIELAARQVFGPTITFEEIELMDPVEVYIQSLEKNTEVTQALAASLESLIEVEHVKAKEAFVINQRLNDKRSYLENVRSLQKEVVEKLQEINVVRESDVIEAYVLAAPSPASLTPLSKASVIFPVAGFLGLLFGGALALLVEILNRAFNAPEDVQRRLHLPVLGHVPFLKLAHMPEPHEGSNVVHPTLVTFHDPPSTGAEAYRGIRSALLYGATSGGAKIVQITSANAGDGKSTLSSNLSISLAQSDKRVVLIGADLRRPSLAALFGISNDVGLGTVLAGDAKPADVIQQTGVPGLAVMPGGPPPPNPGELLTSPRFKQMLDELASRYDFILLDTSPVLAVTDPCTIAAQVDGVLLAICNSRHARSSVSRSVERLTAVGARLLGVIVKGNNRCSGPGGFGYERSSDWHGYPDSYGYYQDAKYYNKTRSSAEKSAV